MSHGTLAPRHLPPGSAGCINMKREFGDGVQKAGGGITQALQGLRQQDEVLPELLRRPA